MFKKKREEERRILAELEEAVQAERKESEETPERAEKTAYCPRCKSEMTKGACPTCGYKIYIPMDEAKRKKIRTIITVVCLVAFVVIFAAIRLK